MLELGPNQYYKYVNEDLHSWGEIVLSAPYRTTEYPPLGVPTREVEVKVLDPATKCGAGWHACKLEQLAKYFSSSYADALYVCELENPIDRGDKVVGSRMTLIRRIGHFTDARRSIIKVAIRSAGESVRDSNGVLGRLIVRHALREDEL